MAKLYGDVKEFDLDVITEALEMFGVSFTPKSKTAAGKKKEAAQKLVDTISEIKKTKKIKGNPIETYDCPNCDAITFDLEVCPYCGYETAEEDVTDETMDLKDFVEMLDDEKPKRRSRAKAKEEEAEEEPEEKPKRRRGRAKPKSEEIEESEEIDEPEDEPEEVEEKPQRRRGRAKPKEEVAEVKKVKGFITLNGVKVPFEGELV